ncbi:hypothetical protein BJX64DRAFT_283417 [Aspergillus heterothallicus]
MAPAQDGVADNQPSNTGEESHKSGESCNVQKENPTNSVQHLCPTAFSTRTPTPPTKSPLRAAQNLKDGLRTGCASRSIVDRESPRSPHLSPWGQEDVAGSRIPRGTGVKQSANILAQKEARITPELRSSIPVPVQRRSADQLSATLQEKQSESSGGLRLIERPRGPRPRPSVEKPGLVISEQAQGADQARISIPTSMSSSSASSWDFGDEGDVPERPTNVFTGEYRVRTISVPGNQSAGPTLRIATSADDVIMGGTIRDPPSYAITQRTNPSKIRYFDRLLPSTPKVFGSSKGNTPTSDSKKSVSSSQKSTPIARNFCRPQISLDSLPKRDISGKEMSISRKPVGKPSLTSLFSPSSKSLRIENEPLVPKIPDAYCTGQEPDKHQSNNNQQPATPAKTASESEATQASIKTKSSHTPITAIKAGHIQSHPPRTSSLRALSAISNDTAQSECDASGSEVTPQTATNLKRNVTFNNMIPLSSVRGPVPVEGGKPRIPESRSTHLLGSFRSIFKTRIVVSDKQRTKRDVDMPETTNENQDPPSEQNAPDLEKSAKAKPRYTRLSSGVSWNKSVHNPKSPVSSPITPTPSVPRLLAPPNRQFEGNLPSFAQPTKSTRTKATSGLRTPTSTTPEVLPRRPHIRTASTGSPQRVVTGTRRAASNILALSGHKRNGQPHISESEQSVPITDGSTGNLPGNVDAVRSCLDKLCKKITEATTPLDRERHIRLALNLQQQLGDYQHLEKRALEAEEAAKRNQAERKAAEEFLNTSLAEVQAQLDEN